MPSKHRVELENALRSVDSRTAQTIRSLVDLVADDKAGRLTELLMQGEQLRDQIRLQAIVDGGICTRGSSAARGVEIPAEEIWALCVAMGNAVGGPGEAPLTSLLRRLAPAHPVFARLEELAVLARIEGLTRGDAPHPARRDASSRDEEKRT